ncbi:BON domain-containing protein [Actinomadura sp. DC4]|uniref:BON domain-containing protein n=1 Tax=Actinomadura sp. DC4 TaxID=3055069 RepID=UPI0025B1A37A|nr:BON domain-containing protein [Actinomadura sp. DC4]MDN3358933.1 BON domain-containing protein [Actinomadura sp. DC4]
MIFAAGGAGLAPLRPAMLHALGRRAAYRRITVLIGARPAADASSRRPAPAPAAHRPIEGERHPGVRADELSRAASGRLTGIVTRSDLLAVYERPAEGIQREVLHDLIEDVFGMDARRFTVSVDQGTVTLRGDIRDRSAAKVLTDAVRHVEGVVTVIDELTCQDLDRPSATPPNDR